MNDLQRLAKALPKDEPAELVGHLSALASVAKHAVDVFDQHSKAITSRALVLLTTTNDEEEVSQMKTCCAGAWLTTCQGR